MPHLSSFHYHHNPHLCNNNKIFSFQNHTQLPLSLSTFMADNYPICLLGAMDRLWFHQTILMSEDTEPTLLLLPKILREPQFTSESLGNSSSNTSESTLDPEEDFSSIPSPVSPLQYNDTNTEDDEKERPTRLDLITSISRSNSSSPLTEKSSKKLRYLGSSWRLQRTMSCMSLSELELEEVKGFMDLGFTFDKENLCPRMMSVLPGLQRIGGSKNDRKTRFSVDTAQAVDKDDDDEEGGGGAGGGGEKRGVLRPYLSEAWLIKRPDSPLLNLRIPKFSAAVDMKEHLRYWARTVASVIQQES